MQANDPQEMPKAYDPSRAEGPLYQFWLERGYFKPKIEPDRRPFCIIMPPPNVTGELHLGHALTATLEDCLIRWHRMRGDPTLWLPGVDHAGIATQNVVEKELAKEGISRHDLGRDKFLERVWQWVHKYRSVISHQHARLGASCDWDREVFTMDDGPQRAVRTTFVSLFEKGLIYRGERIINWCPRCQTALSDLEVEHQEQAAHLWYVRYPLLDEAGRPTDDYVVIATTRPETIVADVAVAVNPHAERWTKVVGRQALLPIIERPIPIISDYAVEAEFGTGALKITPGHDVVDFEIGERHGLPAIVAVGPDGTMNAAAGPYQGLGRFECRRVIVADLERLGLIEKTEDHRHAIGHCQRCDTIVEPIVSQQWFVKMAPLARPAIDAVRDGRVHIVPRRFARVYMNWMENIRDWCVSRQLWWGHRIPVWYCAGCGEATAAVADPDRCPQCRSTDLEQDPDVLDTWFSSALWPHSTLGWPDDNADLRYFYPTSVLETGHDILFFWVARMIMMGLYNTGDVPFRHTYLHGIVRDRYGRRMSKSLGTGVDPLEAINSYGCDALRFTLATAAAPGNDMRVWDEKLEGGRNFANKIWNAARFVISSLGGHAPVSRPVVGDEMPLEDRWILGLTHLVVGGSQTVPASKGVSQLLEGFQVGEAGQRLHDFFWHSFCDWYLEMAKLRLRAGDASPLPVMAYVLDTSLRLLHPFMPFVTEAAWQKLRPHLEWAETEALIVAPWPQKDPQMEHVFFGAKEQMDIIRDMVQAIRDCRIIGQVAPSVRIPTAIAELAPALRSAKLATQGPQRRSVTEADRLGERLLQSYAQLPDRVKQTIEANTQVITELARVDRIEIVEELPHAEREQFIPKNAGHVNVYVPAAGLIDVDNVRQRLSRQIAEAESEVLRLEERLQTDAFRTRAPAQVVAKHEERLTAARARLDDLRERLSQLIR